MNFAGRTAKLAATTRARSGALASAYVVLIGAGQAGLAVGYFLARAGRQFLILETGSNLRYDIPDTPPVSVA